MSVGLRQPDKLRGLSGGEERGLRLLGGVRFYGLINLGLVIHRHLPVARELHGAREPVNYNCGNSG